MKKLYTSFLSFVKESENYNKTAPKLGTNFESDGINWQSSFSEEDMVAIEEDIRTPGRGLRPIKIEVLQTLPHGQVQAQARAFPYRVQKRQCLRYLI